MPFAPVTLSNGESNVEYLVTGTGPAVVMVHGTFATNEGNYEPLIAELADRFTVIAPNYAGSGATTAPDRVNVDDLADQVLAAAAHAGAETFHLAGHSLGAVTAANLAARYPDRVDSLVLHAPWAATDERGRTQFDLWNSLLRTDKRLLAQLITLTALRPEVTSAWTAEEYAANIDYFTSIIEPAQSVQVAVDREVDIRALLPLITAPTLVLASGQDQIVPIADQREVAQAISGAEYREFDAGHGLPAEDGPGFVEAIAGFFDRQAARVAVS
ncbi:alpha/beta hydrolase [Nocardia sp. NEAU-G5]|uniref:Alpha/beta hydrolase n=1 Tax=Nocardia albiluteola TaxID=2842303 RepID=A0ABS6AQC7_9NOCA|nr:alpha/beta hydrolase [Nocardia albiluteola]MBU3060098.1 alpha/beta hydrolase [Nocardia albiluteola]